MRKDIKHIIKDIEKSQEDIVNYWTRKKKIKTSDIHKILYPKEKTLIPNTIFIPENPKSISTRKLHLQTNVTKKSSSCTIHLIDYKHLERADLPG